MKLPLPFYRLLHRSYSRGSAISHFVNLRVTPLAWMLMGLLGVSLVMGGNLSYSVVILFSALLSGVLGVALLWAALRRGRVSVRREISRRGVAGQPLKYSAQVKNLGRRVLREVALLEVGDDARPGFKMFAELREPGEEERNAFDRTFVFYRWKWLMEKGLRWESGEISRSLDLDPGEEADVRLQLIPRRRGVMALRDVRLVLPDPLGLFRNCRRTEVDEQQVLVYPMAYRVPRFLLEGGGERQSGEEQSLAWRGEGGEFLGLRDYRPGDSRRKIHWRTWARTGTPAVKEDEENKVARYGLVLDSWVHGSSPQKFEEAVSVAAGFVQSDGEPDRLLERLAVHGESGTHQLPPGTRSSQMLLEALARVELAEEEAYQELERGVQAMGREVKAVVLILCGWSPERQGLVDRLRSSGVSLHVFAIVHDHAESLPDGVTALREGTIQEDLMS